MPTRKQRRRRDKSRRHEYEYVWVDDEGHEVEVDPEELKETRAAKAKGKESGRRSAGPGRRVEPPSWRRVGRRTLIFAPLMFLVVWLLKPKDVPPAAAVFQVVVLLAVFIPFSYLMDTFVYRAYQRRTQAR